MTADVVLQRDTSELLPAQIVEKHARECPDLTWASLPKSSDLAQGWRHISYRELAYAVDGSALWTEQQNGPGDSESTIAYIGLNDQRYVAVTLGAIKAGYKTMLPSPRNSQEGQASLFEVTSCKTLYYSEGMEPFVETIKAAVPGLKACKVPSFDEMVSSGLQQEKSGKPYQGHYSTSMDAKVLVLHTSGSTGLPKPIQITNAALATNRTQRSLPHAEPDRETTNEALFKEGKALFTMSPFFHAMGAIVNSGVLCNRGSIVMLPPERPINAQLIIEVLQQAKPASGIFAPSILEQICESPGGMEALGGLEYIFFGGAPLAHESGDKINTVSHVVSIIGSTEALLLLCSVPKVKKDWQYFEWAEGSGVVMEPDSDGLSEVVVKRKPELSRYQAIFKIFPELDEWRTKDLMAPHPEKPGLWTYKGRKDDVIVLSNGEKFNPVGFEKKVESHPLVKGAIVVGQGRFQTGLILEPDWDFVAADKDPGDFLDELWPTIEKANAEAPAHGRVWRSKVAIAKQSKPFRRAAKGSIIRKQTINVYSGEIEALYSNEADDASGKLEAGSDVDTVKAFLRNVFKIKGLPIPQTADDDDDLFSFGVDSLQVLALSSTLSHACKDAGRGTVSARDVYAHPTIATLAAWIAGAGQNGEANGPVETREEAMQKMVEKYTRDFPAASPAQPAPEKHTVIITGTTGSLGNYVLQEYINAKDTAHVYCLNRSAGAESRQRKSFEERNATPDFSKVTFLHTDFSKDRFGLDRDIYNELLQNVDIFIHNAWAVDFNKALESYEGTHIAGTRRCIDFALQAKYRPHISFISSIASVGNWLSKHSIEDFIPETLINDHSLPIPGQGYGESKHVASLILAAAKDVPTTIVRTGQLAGPSVEGMVWNHHEWLPSIVISSKAMGVLPDRLGNQDDVDWVPLDLAAKTVVEVASSNLEVAHMVNPHTVSWSQLVPAVLEAMGRPVEVVPFKVWLEKLKETPTTEEAAKRVPGVKLVDFYEGLAMEGAGLPRMETRETARVSGTLEGMRAVDKGMMQMWMRQWWR